VTLEERVSAAVCVAGSLFVLRWALAGGVIAVLTDLSDLLLGSYLSLGGVGNYQSLDKRLDQVYPACSKSPGSGGCCSASQTFSSPGSCS
jgi:hypothetical protein